MVVPRKQTGLKNGGNLVGLPGSTYSMQLVFSSGGCCRYHDVGISKFWRGPEIFLVYRPESQHSSKSQMFFLFFLGVGSLIFLRPTQLRLSGFYFKRSDFRMIFEQKTRWWIEIFFIFTPI